jgi:hypothetical protein
MPEKVFSDVDLQRCILFKHDNHSTVWKRGKLSGNDLYHTMRRGDWYGLHNAIVLPAVLSK